jgi:ATP-grasp domain
MPKKIVVLETSDVAARYTGLAIRELGYTPLFLLSGLDQYQSDPRQQLMEFDLMECVSTTDTNLVTQALSGIANDSIEAVVTMLDSRITIAQQVAMQLNVKGLDPALRQVSSKAEVTNLIPEYSPCSITVQTDDDLFSALKTLPQLRHLIVKPSRGAGALGFCAFDDLQKNGVDQISLHIQKQADLLHVDTFLIQEKCLGKLVSLEGYVTNGICHFLGFSLRKKIGQTESVNLFPGDEYLTPVVREMAKSAVTTLVERSGLKQGYFHSEFIVDEQIVHLIDANFGRIAGAAISEQMAISFGIDPVKQFVHAIAVGCLGETRSLDIQRLQESLSICYGLIDRAELKKIEFPQKWDLRHTQLLDEKTEIPAMGGDNWAWLGLASGLTEQVLEQIDRVRIITNNGTFRPHYLESGQSLTDW